MILSWFWKCACDIITTNTTSDLITIWQVNLGKLDSPLVFSLHLYRKRGFEDKQLGDLPIIQQTQHWRNSKKLSLHGQSSYFFEPLPDPEGRSVAAPAPAPWYQYLAMCVCVCVCVVSGYITLTLVRGSTSGSASTLAMSSHSMMPYENTSAYRTFIIKISSDNSVWS